MIELAGKRFAAGRHGQLHVFDAGDSHQRIFPRWRALGYDYDPGYRDQSGNMRGNNR